MGFLFGRKKKKIEEPKQDNIIELQHEVNRTGAKASVKDTCDQILMFDKKIKDAKVEYDAVTSYLADMQKIELLSLEKRNVVEDAARNIINLTKERKKYQNKKKNFSERQYSTMEQYESIIPEIIPKIIEEEKHKALIEEDLKKVETEKKKIEEEQDEIIEKQKALKQIAIVIGVIVLFVFLSLAILTSLLQANFKIPFTLCGIFVFVLALLILYESQRNLLNIQMVEAKRKRAIYLYNKLAVKAVNSRNFLEYSYGKYMVLSGQELQKLYQEFIEMQDEARRYQSNTELLNFYQSQLMDELRKAEVVDTEVWIYQSDAILDKKEMVEVRHRLNVRRQKLRDIVEINQKCKETALEDLKMVADGDETYSTEARRFLTRYEA